jgi:hypothetical protein
MSNFRFEFEIAKKGFSCPAELVSASGFIKSIDQDPETNSARHFAVLRTFLVTSILKFAISPLHLDFDI